MKEYRPNFCGSMRLSSQKLKGRGAKASKHHAASVNQTVVRTSAGASEHMMVAKVTNIVSCLEELKTKGVWVVGTDSEAEKLYTEIDYTSGIAIVVGNEGKGVRHLVKEKSDFLVKIPLFGEVGSLYASVAGALVMYEAARGRKKFANLTSSPPKA